MKLLLDQGLPRGAVSLLGAVGLQAVHVGEIGLSTAEDASILSYAHMHDCVVVTLDADFHALLALTKATGPSVIRIRVEGLKAAPVAELLQAVLALCADVLEEGAVVTVQEHRLRIRRLPL